MPNRARKYHSKPLKPKDMLKLSLFFLGNI